MHLYITLNYSVATMYPKRSFLIFSVGLILLSSVCFSQNKSFIKYPSLLWEITGNGLKKPSYLFGTMHVSSKMVFHLPDSLYYAIKNVETVALELNPDVWQGQMVRLDQLQLNYKNFIQPPSSDFLNVHSFQLQDYEDELKAALSSEPTVVNGLLYRSYKSKEDFEEDTFLDLYIFQTGKKLGKRTTGVENYYETEKVVLEAYADMANEKKKKPVETDGESMSEIGQQMEDAYRTGNLDLLDSLDDLMQGSEAFRNKFLIKRNEIQANSIDTILKKSSLFVGVGAAHLAGNRGVIELLRKKGYSLRPILMYSGNNFKKDAIDNLKVPVNFTANTTEDGAYKVDVPGPLYKMATDISGLDRRQYADMSNGTYYLVTRVKTHAAFLGKSEDEILQKVDSLLYENIPGKIIKKITIKKNGYSGFDITNKTRRGDLQRYQIFVTPFEVFVFKMSGKENYVQGSEADKFFSSIKLKEEQATPVIFEPKQGGFKIKLPQQPEEYFNTSSSDGIKGWEYEATDKSGNAFLILKKSVNNFHFLEEDSFDLHLIDESFRQSSFVKKQQWQRLSTFNGYPCMDVGGALKDGGIFKARFIIKGPQYYLLTAKSKDGKNDFNDFFSSFQFTPYKYSEGKNYVDTFFHYSVVTPVVPELEESFRAQIEKMGSEINSHYGLNIDSYWPKTKNELFKNDSTGEMIAVAMQQFPKYYYVKDSASFWKDEINDYLSKTDFILAEKDSFKTGALVTSYKLILRDTNSSRQINRLLVLKNDRLYRLTNISDTLSRESSFIKNFYSTFQPQSTGHQRNIFANTINIFLHDFYSADSATSASARAVVSNIYYSKNDIKTLQKLINNLSFSDKDYFDLKSRLIAELGYIKDSSVNASIVKTLKNIYTEVGDTSTFQNVVLRTLAKKQSKESYKLLKELLVQDPPVFATDYEYTSFFNDISDSLLLARELFPEILQLSTIDDYKDEVNSLLATLVDSSLIRPRKYENYFTKIFFDARLELKKQQAKDEKRSQQEIAEDDQQKMFSPLAITSSKTALEEYAVLLMPFYEKKPQVQSFFNKLLYSKDASVQLSTAVLMLRSNKFVADSILINLASKDQYRIKLYKALEDANLVKKFPLAYKKQVDFARSILTSNKTYDKIDSVEYLAMQPVTFRNKKGIVYFFKYRETKDDDWKIGISGLQPINMYDVSTDNKFVKMTDKKLRADEPLDDQLEKQLQILLISSSKSGKNFYENEDYSRFGKDDL